jgi:hypothetical protein
MVLVEGEKEEKMSGGAVNGAQPGRRGNRGRPHKLGISV